ncbi:ParB N-terminal domain-containing protein [Streptomyces anulatus]|uniref:ParB N-terminal domain-containing protein n=1 Tax=Streptomyces anulatus TaxID=1892 RepID=UPI00344096BE
MPTTPDRPADLLRAAAEKLRALSSAATPGPWKMTGVGDFGWSVSAPGVETPDTEQGRTDAELIALLHPGVGLALANWLESAAERLGGTEAPLAALLDPSALAVARQLLGTTTCGECGDTGACNGGPCPLTAAEEAREMAADRRDRYAAAMALRDGHPEWPVRYEDDERDYRWRADAVMAVADAEVVQAMRAMHDTKEEERQTHRLVLSEALGLGTGAPWDAIRDRAAELTAASPAPADRAAVLAEAAEVAGQMGGRFGTDDHGDVDAGWNDACEAIATGLRRLAGEAAAGAHQTEQAQPDDIQVWPLTRVLTEVRCGSQDWTWDEEWDDLDKRHAGYLDRLEQEITANGITMPVLIGSDGRLWDGHHRLRIAVRLGIGYVPVEITPPAVPAAPEVSR